MVSGDDVVLTRHVSCPPLLQVTPSQARLSSVASLNKLKAIALSNVFIDSLSCDYEYI